MGVKSVVKKIIGIESKPSYLNKESRDKYSPALIDLVDSYKELEDDKLIMTNKHNTGKPIKEIKKIIDGYDEVNFEISRVITNEISNPYPSECLSSGDPIKYKAFGPCLKNLNYLTMSGALNRYPSTVGSTRARQDLVDYLEREGFVTEKTEYHDGLGVHSVSFAISTTQAFNSILKVIARRGDVVIMTAPNYGIFAEMAERLDVHVELINLEEEDGFFVNSEKLAKKIDSINEELKSCKDYSYTPKVVAYLNINPHNPIGNVMSEDNMDLITSIADVCLEKRVFIIDDLIYRDLCFNKDKKAFPIASIPKYFNNTISLFGVSKAYGLAGIRAGFLVMPTPIYWGYASEIFELMDSTPLPQVEVIRGAFNGSDKRYKKFDSYFDVLLNKYLYQLDLVTVLIDGIDNYNGIYKNKIICDIKKYAKNDKVYSEIVSGIELVSIRKGTYPESGFFIVPDFTKIKGKYYKGKKIEKEIDLLKALYEFGRVKYLMGENIAWPYKDEFVGRVNFAIDKFALIHYFYKINSFTKLLKDSE